MNTFDITVLLDNDKATTFTVVPHDNNENSYPTYFQLLSEHKLHSEIRLNNDLEWEVCKGNDLSTPNIQLIIAQIQVSLFRKPEADNPVPQSKEHYATWFDKILNTFNNKKSAA